MIEELVIDKLKDGYSHRQIRDQIEDETGRRIGLATIHRIRTKNGIDEDVIEEGELAKVIDKMRRKGIDVQAVLNREVFEHKSEAMPPNKGLNDNNILIIGDIHAPFTLEGYLKFCRETQRKFNCGTVVYIGDIVDFHSFNYHEKIPEELNPLGELSKGRKMLKDWYSTFPEAYVCLGNHDLIGYRKARTAGLLREFIKGPNEIFEAPDTYQFVEEIQIGDVLYTHGTAGKAYDKCIKEGISLVQGHLHSTGGVQWHKNRNGMIFGMQVGTGIDYDKKVFDYARMSAMNPVLGCGVVLNGNLPIFVPMI